MDIEPLLSESDDSKHGILKSITMFDTYYSITNYNKK